MYELPRAVVGRGHSGQWQRYQGYWVRGYGGRACELYGGRSYAPDS